MNQRLQELSSGPRTSDPIDLVPWLREVRSTLQRGAATEATRALTEALDAALGGGDAAEVNAALVRGHALALYQAIEGLCAIRAALVERPAAAAKALEQCDLLIGALALTYEDLRAGTSANRPAVEQALARLGSS